MHPGTGNCLINVHQVFAFAEGVERHGHRANVESVTTDPQQMVEDTRHFIEHDTDVLAALRHFDAEQLFGRQAVGVLVAHHRHVVETIHVGYGLNPGASLGQFFGGTVQQADVRVGALDDFAIQFEHQAQHAVCSWVLRTKVQSEIADVSHERYPRKYLRAQCAGCFRAARW